MLLSRTGTGNLKRPCTDRPCYRVVSVPDSSRTPCAKSLVPRLVIVRVVAIPVHAAHAMHLHALAEVGCELVEDVGLP